MKHRKRILCTFIGVRCIAHVAKHTQQKSFVCFFFFFFVNGKHSSEQFNYKLMRTLFSFWCDCDSLAIFMFRISMWWTKSKKEEKHHHHHHHHNLFSSMRIQVNHATIYCRLWQTVQATTCPSSYFICTHLTKLK